MTRPQESQREITRILVADDEPVALSMFENAIVPHLNRADWNFYFVKDGREALSLIRRSYPAIDILLTDIMMPNMDGLELLSILTEEFPLIRVIMLSAYSEWKNIETAMAQGAFGFIVKPMNFDILQKTIERAERAKRRYAEIVGTLQAGRKHINDALQIIELADRMIIHLHRNKGTERFSVPKNGEKLEHVT